MKKLIATVVFALAIPTLAFAGDPAAKPADADKAKVEKKEEKKVEKKVEKKDAKGTEKTTETKTEKKEETKPAEAKPAEKK